MMPNYVARIIRLEERKPYVMVLLGENIKFLRELKMSAKDHLTSSQKEQLRKAFEREAIALSVIF